MKKISGHLTHNIDANMFSQILKNITEQCIKKEHKCLLARWFHSEMQHNFNTRKPLNVIYYVNNLKEKI